MKKLSSKAIVLLVALAMFFAFQTGVSAANDTPINNVTTCTATVNGAKVGDGFALYKLVDITYNSANNTVTYAWTTAASAFIAANSTYTGLTVAQFQAKDTAVEADKTYVKTFLGKFAAYVKTQGTAASATATAASTGTATINGLGMGEYVILATGNGTSANVYQIMTVSFKPDIGFSVNTTDTATLKVAEPNITKTVSDADKQVAYGDVITYTVNFTIPTYPEGSQNTTMTVSDLLPTGITYKAVTSIKSDTNATITPSSAAPTAGTSTPSWSFGYDSIKAYQSVTITYTATIGTTIAIGTANTNTVTLTYNADPYGNTPSTDTASASVYSYGIEIHKTNAAGTQDLTGAKFEVYKGHGTTGSPVGSITTTTGYGYLAGLDVGEYTLKEVVAPTGYILDSTPQYVTITDSLTAGTLGEVDASAATSTGYTKGYVTTHLTNTQGTFTLPSTGGMGTWVFTIAGILVMAIAVAVLIGVSRRKKENASK